MALTALWISLVAAVVIGAISIVATSPVPDVTGVDQDVAAVRLTRTGFTSKVVAVRFSEEPPGTVIAQTPRGRSRAADGANIELTVSAGTQRNTMPELAGETSLYAELVLREMGLSTMVVEVVSDQPQGKVLSTKPIAGTHVAAGDAVTISVSAFSQALAPRAYALAGKVVAIEPRYDGAVEVDATYEIALRLASLIEASGGRATVTRKPGETTVSDAAFATRLKSSDAAVFVALGYRDEGSGGVWVLDRPLASGANQAATDSLGHQLAEALRSGGVSGSYSTAGIGALGAGAGSTPGVLAILGSVSSTLDAGHFADASWRDLVARAAYRSVGEFLTK